ncbi:MAG TPA: LysR family transcriptional regulator [Lachnospiraceae bacterium]|nr:LysR family transcriptional regulator [Lachnospiraceae bacterium]
MENNLSLYKIFCAAAESGNISAAAKKLYISQPAVSKAIAKLEQNINATLFIRSSKGVSLTYEGQLLFDSVKSAFDFISAGEAKLQNIVEFGGGHIKFGASTTLCKYILLPYLKDFMKQNPQIQISVESQSTYQTLELLQAGKIDIGLIGKPNVAKIQNGTLTYTPIADIEDIFVATKDYIESQHTTDLLRHSTLLMLNKENMTRQYIDHYLYANQIEPQQLMEITSMDLLIDFAKIGLGTACVIREFVKSELKSQQLVEVPLKSPIPKRSVGFVYTGGTLASVASNRFVKFIHADAPVSF